jgi:hypothetical protein
MYFKNGPSFCNASYAWHVVCPGSDSRNALLRLNGDASWGNCACRAASVMAMDRTLRVTRILITTRFSAYEEWMMAWGGGK